MVDHATADRLKFNIQSVNLPTGWQSSETAGRIAASSDRSAAKVEGIIHELVTHAARRHLDSKVTNHHACDPERTFRLHAAVKMRGRQ